MTRLCLLLAASICTGAAPILAQDANGNGITDRLELPGTQPTSTFPGPGFTLAVPLTPSDECRFCHSPGNGAGPYPAWSGSMMGNAARDPVFWAQLDVAEADEATDPALAGARDLCLRCHIPRGWTGGRSSAAPGPELLVALRGMAMQEDDQSGVQCAFCHRMVDRASVDAVDQLVLNGVNTNPDATLRVPPSYGNGMYVLDRYDVRRGPYTASQIGGWPNVNSLFLNSPADWPPGEDNIHPFKYSPFHRSGNLCGSCHDVSNPAWTPAADKGNAQANFPIERTWTEWRFSAFSARGEDGNCQSCHMNGALNGVVEGGASTFAADLLEPYLHMNDVHVHDLTGGNVWVPRMIAQMVARFQATKTANPGASPVIGGTQAERDLFLDTYYATVLKALYPLGTYARSGGAQPAPQGFDAAHYNAASDRAVATLRRAAQLSATRVPGGDLKVRVWNMTGHKLPTGYPEGRRMWLDVRFVSVDPATGAETQVERSGEYDAATGTLFHDFNLDGAPGPRPYDVTTYTDGSGGALGVGRRTQVYEARLHHTPSGVEFHFIRNNERVSDNRIPPLGWDKAQYQANLAEQVIPAVYTGSQMVYHDAVTGPLAMPPVVEPAYNFDEVSYPAPAGRDVAEIVLWYQSVSREYMEELVAASPRTLVYPPGGGASTFTRGDLLEHAWRTFDFGGQTRMPPVEMARLRVALVDADGDGLSDGWETAHGLDPSSALGDHGRAGDPDADGRSNWQEFQNKTPPNAADFARTAVDLALVLDFSGSMNDPAPGGNSAKIAVLKDAVDLFLKTWKQYAVAGDRIAVVYFSSGVAVEGGGIIDFAALPPGVTVESRIDDLIAAVRARPAGGATAMGGGLQRALSTILSGGAGHRKQVVLFTNGMQNFSPMVRKNASSDFVIAAEPVNPANGVYGNSGETDAGGPAFGTELATLNVPVHTIGIGVSETPDDRWQALLSGLSSSPMARNQFVTRAFELEGAFLNGLVEALRGFSPHLVADRRGTLAADDTTRQLDFVVDAAATRATFILSWAGTGNPGRLEFELVGPDGAPVTTGVRFSDRPGYRLATVHFPLAAPNGRPLAHTGTWRMRIRRAGRHQEVAVTKRPGAWNGSADYRAYLVADVPDLAWDVRFSRPVYRAGDEVHLTVQLQDGLTPVRTLERVTAAVTLPGAALGSRLARADFPAEARKSVVATGGDRYADLAAVKTQALLADSGFARGVRPRRLAVQLHDDGDPAHGDALRGDGVYSAKLGRVRVPGLVTAEVALEGVTARTRAFQRRYGASALVTNAGFSAARSRLRVTRAGRATEGSLVRVRVVPRDRLGNYLGPGQKDRLTIDIPQATSGSVIEDRLDGSYTRVLQIPSAAGARVLVGVDGAPVFEESVRSQYLFRTLALLLVIILLLMLIVFAVWLAKNRALLH